MEATVSTSPALAITGRRKLFEGANMTEAYHQNYDLSPDGRCASSATFRRPGYRDPSSEFSSAP